MSMCLCVWKRQRHIQGKDGIYITRSCTFGGSSHWDPPETAEWKKLVLFGSRSRITQAKDKSVSSQTEEDTCGRERFQCWNGSVSFFLYEEEHHSGFWIHSKADVNMGNLFIRLKHRKTEKRIKLLVLGIYLRFSCPVHCLKNIAKIVPLGVQ